MKFLFSIILLAFATYSCGASKNIRESTKMQEQSVYGSYVISQIGKDGSIPEGLIISIEENSDKFTGFSGCNRFFGKYTLEGNNIKFSNVASTKKFCQKEINNIENQFLKALNMVNTFTLSDNIIFLLENDITLLRANKTVATTKK